MFSYPSSQFRPAETSEFAYPTAYLLNNAHLECMLSRVQKLLMPLHIPKGNKLMSQYRWDSWLCICESCPQFPTDSHSN